MNKVNTSRIAEFTWSSPEGELIGAGKEISEELGRKPDSTDLNERHPFDVTSGDNRDVFSLGQMNAVSRYLD